MRIATFNILHGRSIDDGVVDLDRFAAAIREVDADILGLQEVDLAQPRSGMADLTEVAAQAMGAVAHRFVAAVAGTPGETWVAATGREPPGAATYGVALLSRYPVSAWQVERLGRVPVRIPLYLRPERRWIVLREEPRTAVLARVSTPLGDVTVANTHLSFVPGWNRRQLRQLTAALRGLPGPRVLMGDLNMAPPTPASVTGMRSLAAAATFPAQSPGRQLDHILTDDEGALVSGFAAPRLAVSDHRALTVELS